MKLQGVHDGRLYATRGRGVYADETGTAAAFERVGRLPIPRDGVEIVALADQVLTCHPWKGLLGRFVGRYATTNLWPVTDQLVLATAGRRLFVSRDAGASWRPSRSLPASSGLAGVLPTSVCAQDDAIYLGEYPLDDDVRPRVLRSTDDGRRWRTALSLPDVRHVHGVHADPYTTDVWVTTGDADAACRVGRLRDGRLDVVGAGSQEWRAVDLVFTPDAVLWGMDCPYVDRKRVYRLDRSAFDDPSPHPETVCSVSNSVFYGTTLAAGGRRWVVFSTAVEAGPDSSAPGLETRSSPHARVIAAADASGYRTWYELGAFRRRARPSDRFGGRLPRANAYVYLQPADHGVFVNPYNATPADGSIVRVPVERFDDRALTPTASHSA